MNSTLATTAALLVASLAAALVVTGTDPFWATSAAVMLAGGHLILTAVTIVGALVGAARWSVGVGAGLASILFPIAVLHPVGIAWGIMLTAAAGAVAGTLGTRLRATVRQRPAADAPPRKAVALALGLLAAPLLIAAPQPDGVDIADWLLAGGALTLALWYTRGRPDGLWAVRSLLPVSTFASVFSVPLPWSPVVAAGFAAATWLAWSSDARVAVIPLATPGRRVPIPAELAPGEILDAAGVDDRGRKRT